MLGSSLIMHDIYNKKYKKSTFDYFNDFDKYGRPLAYIYKNSININEKLVEKGLANKYDGGKKEDKWLNYLKND